MAISVIILLIGIGFVGTARFIEAAKIKQVETMMQGLIGANVEFKAQRKQGNVNHGGSHPVRWNTIPLSLTSSERFVYACRQNKAVEAQMLAAVNSGEDQERAAYQDRDGDGVEEIYDVWGTQIVYRSFNDLRTDDNNENPDDGAVDNANLPNSQSPFFVSAGPDRTFHTDDDITSILE